jgi:hypothetical protein
MNVNLSNGTNVLGVFEQGVLTSNLSKGTVLAAGVVARDATWGCQFQLAEATGSCTNQFDPSMIVQW